jgi:hypothetical protein
LPTPALTTIADMLYAPNGTLVDGQISITNTSTMVSPDGYEIPQGTTFLTKVDAGVFSVGLVPNTGSTPTGTSYQVKYKVSDQWFTETWIIPQTSPVNLADVRSLTPPIPSVLFSIQQATPPAGMISGDVLGWNGEEWVPSTGRGVFMGTEFDIDDGEFGPDGPITPPSFSFTTT